jgi:hypothetical protein
MEVIAEIEKEIVHVASEGRIPTRIYMDAERYNKLRRWTEENLVLYRLEQGKETCETMLFGCRIYTVTEANHLFVA